MYEPSHSPFGFVWQVASATGWSVEYILRKVNYQTLIMMLSDAPRYVRKKREDTSETTRGAEGVGPVSKVSARKEAAEIVSFFQSNLET